MARLPTPGSDDGTWGDILNDFLTVSHNADGTLGAGIVSDTNIAGNAAISKSKLASSVQTSLSNADAAYQKPVGGIPKTDLEAGVQTSLGSADSAYQKPVGGIPKTDLETAVQTSLGKADTALQSAPVTSVAGQTGAVTLTKDDVGLSNVDDTADADKPISTASQAALDTKADATATQTALNAKVDTATTVNGHALSSNVTLAPGDIGLPNITVSTSAPTSPAVGDIWVDTN